MAEIQNPSTIYDYTRNSQSIYNKTKPFQQMEEVRVSQMLLENATAEAANRKPPIPYLGRVTPRYGYRTDPPGISDILNVDDVFPSQFGDWSGRVSGYLGTSFPSNPSLP